MNLRLFFRYAVRESRGSGSRLVFLAACLAIGVGAVVAVQGLSAGIEESVRSHARQMLAADLSVSSHRTLPAALDRGVGSIRGARRIDTREMATIAAAPGSGNEPGKSQLVELKVVGGGYPFYGELKLDPNRPAAELLGDDAALVAPEALARLGLAEGDSILLGGVPFRIAGRVLSEPDRMGGAFSLGPRVFLSDAGFSRTRLESFGSRILHRALVALPSGATAEDVDRAAALLTKSLGGSLDYRVATFSEAQPELRQSIRRMGRFLGLSALLSLLIGGVGVAQTVRAWLASRLDAVAVLECLGFRPRDLFRLFAGQLLLLGLAGSVLGAGLGTAVLAMVPRALADVALVQSISIWQPAAIFEGLALGVAVALLFSLPPLISALRVPPARVLRRDAEPLPLPRAASAAVALVFIAGLAATAVSVARSIRIGLELSGSLVALTACLAGAAALFRRIAGRTPRESGRFWIRHGLASFSRPGSGTTASIVSLGLGIVVVLSHYLIHQRLDRQLRSEFPADAPTAFLIDIQPDQWQGVKQMFESEKIPPSSVESVPVVMARLRTIDGRRVEDIAERHAGEEERSGRWALTREQRLTYLEKLPAGNIIREGTLWKSVNPLEISVEAGFAKTLGAHPGSRLGFDIQGVPIEFTVTSTRSVDWKTFGINFFFVARPGSLDEAPQSRLAAARIPPDAEDRVQNRLAREFPNVTMIRVRDILEKIAAIFERLGLAVRMLGAVVMFSGLVILAGAVAAGSIHRGREVALLKALGATRREIVARFALEYALIGFVAGLVGSAGAVVISWALAARMFELPFEAGIGPLLAATAGAMALSVIAGLAASAPALAKPPIEALREG